MYDSLNSITITKVYSKAVAIRDQHRWRRRRKMTIQERKAIPIPQVEARAPIPVQDLRIPGPTTVPAEVLTEMARPMINHRGPEFAAIVRRVTARLQYFFQTASPVLTYASSGTGGQEATIANLFS